MRNIRRNGHRGEHWHGHQRVALGYSSKGGRSDWRASLFSIFVDRLSRRVSIEALWKAFGEYGKVMDVFIPFHDSGNRERNTTFAFVRYKQKSEMLKAIEEGNMRRIDGWFIRVKEASYSWRARRVSRSNLFQ
ncbi:hypothetical protein DITRI_Ditri02bG0108000 [Diplodiscus trichospermus]